MSRERTKKIRKKLNMGMRFSILVMAELLVITAVSWAMAEFLNVTLDVPIGVWVIGLSLLLGAAINSFLTKSFFDPITKLGEAMQQVAEGDFEVQLESKKNQLKEIGEIYANFNLMVKELKATEILQTDFVSNVSHEFKTPINAIEGYATLLQGSEQSVSEEQEIYVEKILFNTKRLSHLAGNILLLSKIDNQVIKNKQKKFRLDEQVRQSIVMLEPEWSQKEIELEADLEDIEYVGNESLLHHVWDNLIGNAIKFSPQGGTICINMIQKENQIVFSVEDNGPGINEEAKKHIFNKFYQGDSAHKEEGNGLGLALVKKILHLCGGTVSVENIPGGGCRFIVVL